MTGARIAIYGSGVSGLIAAYFLQQKGLSIDVVDPYEEAKIQTLRTEDGLVELAANSILANPEVLKMLDTISLDYFLYRDVGKKKYIMLADGRLRRWPLSFLESIKAFKPLLKFAKKNPEFKPKNFETIETWGLRNLTPPLLHKLICPGLQGVYGASAKDVSAKLSLGHLFDNNEAQLSRNKTRGSLSFLGGMGDFTKALRRHLIKNNVRFLKEVAVEPYLHHVVSSPSYSLPDVVSDKSRDLLKKVSYKAVSTMTLFVEEEDKQNFSGFGCVFESEPQGVLGLILNSELFDGRAAQGLSSETWILNGELISTRDEALRVISEIRRIKFSKSNKIKSFEFKFWERAFPKYNIELEQVLYSLEEQKGLSYFANWTGSLGIGSMIQNGEAFATKVLEKINRCEHHD